MKSICFAFFVCVSVFVVSPVFAVGHQVLISDPSVKGGQFKHVEFLDDKLYGFYSAIDQVFFFYGALDSLKIKSLPKGSRIVFPYNMWKPRDIYPQAEVFYKNNGKIFAFNILTFKEKELTGINEAFYYNKGQVVSFGHDVFAVYDLNSDIHISLTPLIRWGASQKQTFLNLYYDFQNKNLMSLGISGNQVYVGKTFQTFQLVMEFQPMAELEMPSWERKTYNRMSDFSWLKVSEDSQEVTVHKYDFLHQTLSSKTLACSLEGWLQTYKGNDVIECREGNQIEIYDLTGLKILDASTQKSFIGFNDNVVAEGFVLQYSANSGVTLWDRQRNKIGFWGGSNYVKNAFIQPIETFNYGLDIYLGDYLLTYTKKDWSPRIDMRVYSTSLKKEMETTTDWGGRYSLPNGSLLGFSDKNFEIVLDEAPL